MTLEPFIVDRSLYDRVRSTSPVRMEALAAFGRINALAAIEAAAHGWIGACFSVTELVTTLYFGAGERNVVLSKGHAAPAQYACLYGLGLIDRRALLAYKDGPGAPQAHTDRCTPGILVNTGSLGQSLSKSAALAWRRPAERFAVIVGDGELQEGQNYEALMTLGKLGVANLTLIVDANGYQSKRRVAEVKPLPDLEQLFGAFGLATTVIDGHDCAAIAEAWRATAGRPAAIVARTVKGGGSRLLLPVNSEQPWHGRVPDRTLYLELLDELAAASSDDRLIADVNAYRRACVATASGPRPIAGSNPSTRDSSGPSTRDAYATALAELLPRHPEVVVLDADLAEPCGLARLAGHPQLLELGIAEQDMVSFAGGLALTGALPLVNTYAAFLKRAYEQIWVNATEGSKLVYVGHYAGLGYFTDGKTHQCLSDLKLMQAVPGLAVLEPSAPAQVRAMLEWALCPTSGPVYLRLHRTAVPLDLPDVAWRPDRPLLARKGERRWFVTTGPIATRLALDCLATSDFGDFGLLVQSSFNVSVDQSFLSETLCRAELVITVEEDLAPGTLFAWTTAQLAELTLRPRVVDIAPRAMGASFRTLAACRKHFNFTVDAVRARLLAGGQVPGR